MDPEYLFDHQSSSSDWKWYHALLAVGGGMVALGAIGYIASGGKTHTQMKIEDRKKRSLRAHAHPPGEMGAGDPMMNFELENQEGGQRGPHPPHSRSGDADPMADPTTNEIFQILKQGEALRQQGRVKEALAYYRRARDTSRRSFGEENLFIVIAEQHMVLCLMELQEYEEAETVILNTIQLMERNSVEDQQLMEAQGLLAQVYFKQGRYSKAEPICAQVCKSFESAYGSDSTELAAALDQHSSALSKLHQHVEAIQKSKRAVEIGKDKDGDSPMVIEFEAHYISNLLAAGHKIEGKAAMKELVLRTEQLHGKQSLPTAMFLNYFASTYLEAYCWEEAEELYRTCLERWGTPGQTDSKLDPAYLNSFRTDLSYSLIQQNRMDEARDVLLDILKTPPTGKMAAAVSLYMVTHECEKKEVENGKSMIELVLRLRRDRHRECKPLLVGGSILKVTFEFDQEKQIKEFVVPQSVADSDNPKLWLVPIASEPAPLNQESCFVLIEILDPERNSLGFHLQLVR